MAIANYGGQKYSRVIWSVLAVAAILMTVHQVWASEPKHLVSLEAAISKAAELRGDIVVEIFHNNPSQPDADRTRPSLCS
jgi:hypothetical protein